MSLSSRENQSRGVQTAVRNGGLRPQLFTVAAGSYASNSVYGSGVSLVNDYNDEILQGNSRVDVRQSDRDVDYSAKVLLDLSLADPAFPTGEEVRLRTLQPLRAGEPGRYSKRLPVQDVKYRQPLFLDVEIVDPSTGAPFAGFPSLAGAGQLQARLLHGGELAFVVSDLSAGPPPTVTPLTAGDLAALFGASAGTQLQISVRGSYRGQSHP